MADFASADVRRPSSGAWLPALVNQRHFRAQGPWAARGEAWQHGSILVLSNVENVTPGGWTWSVLISDNGRRPGRTAMRLVRAAFGMQEAEEDNHAPRQMIRHLWLPIDPAERVPCGCARIEAPTIGDAGTPGDLDRYVWRPGLNERAR